MNSLDIEKSITAILAGERISMRYPGLLDDRINFLSGFLHRLLSRFKMEFISELILTLLRELTFNCSKANAKRIYFDAQKADIHNAHEYARTMASFKEKVLLQWDEFCASNEKNGYFIELSLQISDKILTIEISNNCALLKDERERIDARMSSFQRYHNLNDAFSAISDLSEGAGFGIVMSLIMLKNAGIDPNNLIVESSGDKTTTRLRIPFQLRSESKRNAAKINILKETKSLPAFPENILRIIEICDNPFASLKEVAAPVEQDPGLAAQVLKLAHSGGYISRNHSPTLLEAIGILGLKEMKNILLISGTRQIFSKRYDGRKMDQIWESSGRISFFARQIAQKGSSVIRDTASLAGLLHGIGKIVLNSLHPEFVRRTKEMMGSRRVRNSEILEEISIGISHAEIGALLAEKWNFGEALITAIRFQLRPLFAPAAYTELVHCIYFALMLDSVLLKTGNYYAIESETLEHYKIESETHFNEFAFRLGKLYELEFPQD